MSSQHRTEAQLEAVVVRPAGNQFVGEVCLASCVRAVRFAHASRRTSTRSHRLRGGRDAGARRTARRSGSGARPAGRCRIHRLDHTRQVEDTFRHLRCPPGGRGVRIPACRPASTGGRRPRGAACAVRWAPRGQGACRSCRTPSACRPQRTRYHSPGRTTRSTSCRALALRRVSKASRRSGVSRPRGFLSRPAACTARRAHASARVRLRCRSSARL